MKLVSTSITSSPSGSTSASGVPGSTASARTMIPEWSAPSSSSRSERIIPSETSPRSFACSSFSPPGQHRARQRDRDGRARAEVPGAADDLARLALPHVHRAELEPVGVRVLARLEHAADAEEAEVAVDVGHAARTMIRSSSKVEIASRSAICASSRRPRRTRAARRWGSSSELPQESQVVLPERAHVGQAVAEHGDPLEPEAEREAGDLLRVVADVPKTFGSTTPAPPISIQPEYSHDAAARAAADGSTRRRPRSRAR